MEHQKISPEDKTWAWLDAVVIGERLCPFAKAPRDNDQINLVINKETNVENILTMLVTECKVLDNNPDVETTLVALTHGLADFYDYLDVLDMAQQLIEELGYDGVYQLASFHPAYLFEGEPANSTSHFTNRAPYPMFHFIREKSITKALTFVENPDDIPARNIEHANKLGADFFKQYL